MGRKHFVVLVVAAVLAVAAAKPASVFVGDDEYITTPAGYIRKDCVNEVPNGAQVEERQDEGAVYVTHPKVKGMPGRVEIIPFCDTAGGKRPVFLEHVGGPFPPDYDGWEEYTVAKTDSSYDTFIGYFSVPNSTPQDEPQVLYLFTGLQNINWIPKATPLPSVPFDIIQPVLQYPSTFGSGWSVKSWWVTLQGGAMYSTELLVNPGDAIFGNMTRTGTQTYYVGSTIKSTGKVTGLSYTNNRLQKQPWAYNTLECYGCTSCATYPTDPSVFSKLQIYSGDKVVPVKWAANQYPAERHFCHESVTIEGSDEVTIHFT